MCLTPIAQPRWDLTDPPATQQHLGKELSMKRRLDADDGKLMSTSILSILNSPYLGEPDRRRYDQEVLKSSIDPTHRHSDVERQMEDLLFDWIQKGYALRDRT